MYILLIYLLKFIFICLFILCRIDGEDIRIMLWDTAGQEEFDAITKAYYRGAQACVLAFSTTDRMSFEAIKDWKMKVRIEIVVGLIKIWGSNWGFIKLID